MKTEKVKRKERHKPYYRCASHMRGFLNPKKLKLHVRNACRVLQDYDFDTIAFRGMSGALIGPPVAVRMNKSMILVRKDGDTTHSGHVVEGDANVKRYIILDDFVDTGETMRIIQEKIKKFAPQAECLGLFQVQYIDDYDIACRPERRYAFVSPIILTEEKPTHSNSGLHHQKHPILG